MYTMNRLLAVHSYGVRSTHDHPGYGIGWVSVDAVASERHTDVHYVQVSGRGLPGCYFCWEGRMSERDAKSAYGLGLSDAIGLLRDELLKARAAGAASDIQLPVESMTVELTVTATRSLDGKAGFTVPV